jgi:hypothetical protein
MGGKGNAVAAGLGLAECEVYAQTFLLLTFSESFFFIGMPKLRGTASYT